MQQIQRRAATLLSWIAHELGGPGRSPTLLHMATPFAVEATSSGFLDSAREWISFRARRGGSERDGPQVNRSGFDLGPRIW